MSRDTKKRTKTILIAFTFLMIAHFLFWSFTSPVAPHYGQRFAKDRSNIPFTNHPVSGLLGNLTDSGITISIEHRGHLNFVETAEDSRK